MCKMYRVLRERFTKDIADYISAFQVCTEVEAQLNRRRKRDFVFYIDPRSEESISFGNLSGSWDEVDIETNWVQYVRCLKTRNFVNLCAFSRSVTELVYHDDIGNRRGYSKYANITALIEEQLGELWLDKLLKYREDVRQRIRSERILLE